MFLTEVENNEVDMKSILTNLKDDPQYSDLMDIRQVDRKPHSPGWVSLSNSKAQVYPDLCTSDLHVSVVCGIYMPKCAKGKRARYIFI